MSAVGVARPRAQGQAMMRTVIIASRPWEKPAVGANKHHNPKVNKAIPMITGTKIPAILSTSFCTGALLPWASCTMRMIWASMVSAPVLSAVKWKAPFWFTVPAYTFSPACLCTAIGSPLSMLSSTYESPLITVPSTAIRSPGFTAIVSPIRAFSIGTVCSPDPVTIVIVLGCRPASLRIAVEVFCFARSSSKRPRRIKAIIPLAASKYKWGVIPRDNQKSGNNRLNTLNR